MRNIWTTLVVLIVTAFSAVAEAADDEPTVVRASPGTREEVVALGSPTITVRLSTDLKSKADAPFSWLPDEDEKRWIYLVLHHSATKAGSIESIHRNHSQRRDAAGKFWLGIGYHFVIGNGNGMEDGAIEPTFRWRQQIHGAHSGSVVHNANGIGICLIGNFENEKPTARQLEAVKRLTKQLAARYKIPERLVIGHKTVKPTACPGRHFPLQDVRRNLKSGRESKPSPSTPERSPHD